jgi:dihydropteroate synthase
MTTREKPPPWRSLSLDQPERQLYLVPVGRLVGAAAAAAVTAGWAWRLAGGPLAFTGCRIILRRSPRQVEETPASVGDIAAWMHGEPDPVLRHHLESLVDRLIAVRPPFAGLPVDRPRVMGVINVTPDSFSDGGRFAQPSAAIAHGLALREAGADILDVGGESARPGAAPVGPAEEMRRILPVVRGLAEAGAIVSVDTRRAPVMAAAIETGAAIINDISGLSGDPGALPVVAAGRAAVILMHMQGEPSTMQTAPRYGCVAPDVYDYLADRLAVCRRAGIAPERLCADPGIGFGKTVDHTRQLMSGLALFHGLGVPLLLGVSRKSFIARMSRGEGTGDRLAGSLAAALAGLDQGVQIVRVHDVGQTRQAIAVWSGTAEGSCRMTADDGSDTVTADSGQMSGR